MFIGVILLRQSHRPVIRGSGLGGVRVRSTRFARPAEVLGSPRRPVRAGEAAATLLRLTHGAKPGRAQPGGSRGLWPPVPPVRRPPVQWRLLTGPRLRGGGGGRGRRRPPGLLAPLGGTARGAAAVEDLGAVGQQRGAHLPPLLEAARVGDAEAPAVAAAAARPRGLAAAEGGRLLLPAAGAGGGCGGLAGSGGGGRRGGRRFLVLLLAGQRLPPGPRRAALHAGAGGGGGRGAVRHLGLLRREGGGRERGQAGSRARRHPARRGPPAARAGAGSQRKAAGTPLARHRGGRQPSRRCWGGLPFAPGAAEQGTGSRVGAGGGFCASPPAGRAPVTGSETPPRLPLRGGQSWR